MAKTDYQSVDDYIAAQPATAQPVLKRVRAVIRKALRGSTEGISYQIPVFKQQGAMVLYLAGFRDHYSIYPASGRLIAALKRQLAGHLHGRATIRFSYAEAIPSQLITRITKLRAAEAQERVRAKASKKKHPKKKLAKTPKKRPSRRTTKR
ncbi:MAG TPA: DUF1801 domain-containing protein [Polyangiaceae bacterium]|nr:DUF1801 domain-containing protein [Polyangiaceae bacterium]